MKFFILLILTVSSSFAGELKLVGKSLLEYSIFKIDVYAISLYRDSSGLEELHLDYKVDVEKKHSLEGWKVGLEHILKKDPALTEGKEWILNNTKDYSKGDLVILRRENNKVSILKNNELIGQIEDQKVAQLIFEPWIGQNPISNQIKKELLGI